MSHDAIAQSAHLGFTTWILPRPGLPGQAHDEFAHRLDNYLVDQDLQTDDDTSLRLTLHADCRDLTEADQVNLLHWLLDDPLPAAIRLGPLTPTTDDTTKLDDGHIRIERSDLILDPLGTLYRLRRITASQYLEILGGYVRPVCAGRSGSDNDIHFERDTSLTRDVTLPTF